MEKSPIGGNKIQEETSAYRSYKKREQTKGPSLAVNTTESLEKFSKTIELLNNKKVNRANAFENRLVDEIGVLFEEFAKGGNIESLWQKYSTGIDACGKIYGFCVDSVHNDTLSILQGLNRTGVVQEAEDESRQEKKKKKRIMGGVNTLETDESTISTTKFENHEDFDVYFKSVSSKFDATNFSGLLMNNISVSDDLDLIFASDNPIAEQRSELPVRIQMPVVDMEKIQPMGLCDKFQRFTAETLNSTQALNALLSMEKPNDFIVGSESEETYIEESAEELEVDLLGSPKNGDDDNLEGISENLATRISKLAENDDYKFFHQASSWAGFEYAKSIVCGVSKASEKKQRKKREPVEDTFQLDVNFKLDRDTFFPKPKKNQSNTLSESTIKKWKDNKIRLPEDFHFNLKRFCRLFTRPKTFVKSLKGSNERKHVIIESDLEDSADEGLFVESGNGRFEEREEVDVRGAIKSKQVDIKKLKDTIVGEVMNNRKLDTFYGILDDLTGRLPDVEIEQLSVHSCFITILHLANENEFRLQGTDGCDFRIIRKG